MMKPKYYIKRETTTANASASAIANVEDEFPSLGKAKPVVRSSSTLNYLEAAKTVPVPVVVEEKEEEVIEEDKQPVKKGFSFD
jgi:hypothetical protein